MNDVTKHATEVIERYRMKAGVSKSEVARCLDMTRETLSRGLNQSREFTFFEIALLAAYFNIPLSELFDTNAILRAMPEATAKMLVEDKQKGRG
jgi:transcriptional regulator with XRE-family HTH domain